MSAEHFSVWSNVLHYGNRADCEHLGTGEEDDWYSWESHIADDEDVDEDKGGAYITVFGEAPVATQYRITWERVL